MNTDLVVRAQGGDRGAFTEIADVILDRYLAVAHRILRDGSLAEDATQAALLGIWRDLPKLRDPTRFGAWSMRLLVNACYSEARRAHHWLPNVPLESAAEPVARDDYDVIVDRDQLERGFHGLPVDQRAVIVLHHYVGMSLAAVAETLDVPEGTVRSRLHRGMTAVRSALAADIASSRPERVAQEIAP